MSSIGYDIYKLRTIDAASTVRIYDVTTGAYMEKPITRFTDDLYGKGAAQDIIIRGYQYTANGKTQKVSMSQLFMTICMNRANDLELKTVDIMGEMSKNTTALSELAALEDIILNDTKTPISYTVDCCFDFLDAYRNYITSLGTEIGLTPPSCIPTFEEVKKTITTAEFETYKSFLSSIIEENRKRLQENPSGERMGQLFRTGLDYYRGDKSLTTLSEAMISLFGSSAEEFETCKWFKESQTMTEWLTTTQGYKVGEHTFKTLKEVQDYASNTYQIDITKSDATTALESKMDEYNTLSQDQMIELQSLVEKRNQAYTLVSNSLKSMYNSNSANANNLR